MRSVLVTGASGGVGRATALRLRERGWRVFAGVRSLEAVRDLGAEAIELDVTDRDSIARARDELAGRTGQHGLQGLVNNAGLSVNGPLELVTTEALRRQFEVNVVGPVAVTQAFLPMLRSGSGRIVNVGGAAGRSTLPMYGALSASKAALDAVSDALRMELVHQGVSVSYIEPGGLATSFFATAADASRRDGYAGGPETEGIYARAIEAAGTALAASRTSPVEDAARAIERALTDRRPAARYPVGRDARLVLPLLRHLPARVRDRLVMGSLKIGRDAFASPPTSGGPRSYRPVG
jgi:NAD(P)-dependent dehydrogenase (short-subunit alcohol dehydrogenase family)